MSASGHMADPDQAPLTVWPPARQALAAAAAASALLTGLLGAAAGSAEWAKLAAVAHVVAAAWALSRPVMIGAQVGAGVVLAWAVLPHREGAAVGALVVVVVAGVVATSELLGACARLRMVIERDVRSELGRVGRAVAIAVAVGTATVASAGLAGPAGLVATAVAAVGCALVAVAVSHSDGHADGA